MHQLRGWDSHRETSPSAHRAVVIGDRAVESSREALDALSRRIECGDDRWLCRLGAAGRDDARVLQSGELVLEPLQLLLLLRQLIGECQRRHDCEPSIADITKARA